MQSMKKGGNLLSRLISKSKTKTYERVYTASDGNAYPVATWWRKSRKSWPSYVEYCLHNGNNDPNTFDQAWYDAWKAADLNVALRDTGLG
jgi:hypothetical protein